MRRSILPLLFSILFVFSLHSSTESGTPFSVNVLVEEGENVTGWEDGIFGKTSKKKEDEHKKKEEEKSENKEDVEKSQEKESSPKESHEPENIEEPQNETENVQKTIEEEPDPDVDGKEPEYGKNDPKWGRYYGDSKQIEKKYEPVDVEDKNEETQTVKDIVDSKNNEEFVPIDILLWSHGGDGYLAMINTGVRVSYLNMYSTLSLGTDYSDSIERPMSLGVNLGGYYRIDDFLITADLGYEKIWDFGDNPELNDYALGLKAGLSYSVWSWFAISAGAGVNYNILKDDSFEKGRFSPMIFGGFEFNLMK